jgi:hypothetical protein
MEWRIYKHVPPPKNVKMLKTQNYLSHIQYDIIVFTLVMWDFFLNLILYQTLSPKLIAQFVNMHVGMDWKTIVKTQTTINPLNMVIFVQLSSR